MKKTAFYVAVAMILSFTTACGQQNAKTENSLSESESQATHTENSMSESESRATNEKVITYTDKDIYINSFRCDYISQEQKPEPYKVYVIETQEQLDYAKENSGIGFPSDYNAEDYWYYNVGIVEAFEKMEEDYPFSEYCYVFEYEEVGSTGYYYHADKVVIDTEKNIIYFKNDDKSYSPDEDDICGEAMNGFFHMSAIPREYIDGYKFNDNT
ncbi:MAG: hypothetical protein K2J08_02570 [Ruminococcus sp.]|nr:hypothetical protein [Ruminococcus sp.]